MRITVLGAGDAFSNGGRRQSGYFIEVGGTSFLLDCGTTTLLALSTMPEPIDSDSPEMSFRRGYQHGVIDMFRAIERLLDPATRDVLKDWIEKDVYAWRTKAMLGYPPLWRLRYLASQRSM